MNILIVEDDLKIARAIQNGLEAECFHVVVERTGDDGYNRLRSETFDLVVLDWMLPGMDGVAILRSLREKGADPPVLLLTARDAVEDRVHGLDAGADDYLVKPFAFAELLARVRVLLRRSGLEETVRRQTGDLVLDVHNRKAWRAGEEIMLTPREFEFLSYLMRHDGQVVTRQMLAREVWREPNRSTPLDNVIDVHLARLRKKVDGDRVPKLIRTVRGVGFVLRGETETRPRPL